MDIRKSALIFLGVGFLTYLLYITGYIEIKLKRAIIYIGAEGNSYKNHHKAKVVACSGFVRRVIRLKENKAYIFSFHSVISKGNIKVELRDTKRKLMLSLDKNNKEGTIHSDRKGRYYLVIKFDKADGDYELTWT